MKSLNGKVVVITGAGSGIGRALALAAADRGARLALSDVDEDGLAVTAQIAAERSPGHKHRTDRLDVSDRAAFSRYAEQVVSDLGVVNVVVNNAGVALTASVAESSFDDLDWVMGIDFWGVVHGTKAFLPHLIASGDGHVVNISSLFGLMAVPTQGAYNAAKFAVRGFTESLRTEMLADRLPVGVTCVHPGGIKTAIARNARAAAGRDQQELARYFDRRLAKTGADSAAEQILRGVQRNRARVIVGPDAKALDLLTRTLGGRSIDLIGRVAARGMPKAASQPKRTAERSGAAR